MVPLADEAELKMMTVRMYQNGGAKVVFDCVKTMQECQVIILKKLKEILEENRNELDNRNSNI
jgi:hypothetical protein